MAHHAQDPETSPEMSDSDELSVDALEHVAGGKSQGG